MPRQPINTVQLALRVPPEFNKEADEIAKLISRPGVTLTRSDAYRAAIARGFEAIRADVAAQTAAMKGAKPARKPVK